VINRKKKKDFFFIQSIFCFCQGISSALPALTNRPHELFIAGAISEMIGLSVCYALASRFERRRLLIVFFIATALASALVPLTHDTEPYGNDLLLSVQ